MILVLRRRCRYIAPDPGRWQGGPNIEPLVYAPPSGDVPVLHRDADILIVEKPAGLLSVPGKAAAHADCVLGRLRARDPSVLLVHRLDMDTSGLMVFARNPAAQRHLGLQFERRHLRKTYLAIVGGQPDRDSGTVDLPLIADWPNRPLQKVCHETGRPARTDWRVLGRDGATARVELAPLTGRSHQLRVHMAALGHPILGDRFYGGAVATRLHLHASGLSLRHPTGGIWRDFSSPAPF